MAELTFSDKSFQIFGALYAKLRPKCLVNLYMDVAKCGTSKKHTISLASTCIVHNMSRFKKRFKICRITSCTPVSSLKYRAMIDNQLFDYIFGVGQRFNKTAYIQTILFYHT